jgi:hypothetical protein
MKKYIFLALFICSANSAFAVNCGLNQTNIADRILDCSTQRKSKKMSSSGVFWVLVSRKHNDHYYGSVHSTWKDTKSGLVWSDKLTEKYTHDNFFPKGGFGFVVRMDQINGKVVEETACSSADGKIAQTDISEIQFHLPTIEEYQIADEDGFSEVLETSDPGEWYWSSTVSSKRSDWVHAYQRDGYFDFASRSDTSPSVRCAGR